MLSSDTTIPVLFRLNERTREAINRLFETGQYSSLGAVIEVAIHNLETLMESKEGDFERENFTAKGNFSISKTVAHAYPQKDLHLIGQIKFVPELLNRPSEQDVLTIKTADIFHDSESTEFSLGEWIHGFQNKILPLKVTCRSLANLTKDTSEIQLEKARNMISQTAYELGNLLAESDRDQMLNKDDAFNTAFPTSFSDTPVRSRARYSNQFVGHTNKQSEFFGLPADYKLVTYLSKSDSIILTTTGLKLAVLFNPLIDSDVTFRKEKLTSAERILLLDHIRNSVPREVYAFKSILTGIKKGANNPEKIDDFLNKTLPPSRETLTKGFLSSQRSGAISRMADLNLVRRERTGVRVAYSITEEGSSFLKEVQKGK